MQNANKEETVDGVKGIRVGAPSVAGRYWSTMLSTPEIWRRARNADIIHTTTWTAAFPAWLVAKLRRKPCVITVHEVNAPVWRYSGKKGLVLWLHKLYEKAVFSLGFNSYIAVSEYTKGCLVEYFNIPGHRINVIYNAVEYDLFNPVNTDRAVPRKKLGLGDRFVYMYYGRPGFTKGVEYLVRAVPLIAEKVPDARLLLVLSRDPADGYRKITGMIKEAGMGDSVILLEPLPLGELVEYIAAADCVVVPSLSEGFGFTAAEACAMGKPVVASDTASLPESSRAIRCWKSRQIPKAIGRGWSGLKCECSRVRESV